MRCSCPPSPSKSAQIFDGKNAQEPLPTPTKARDISETAPKQKHGDHFSIESTPQNLGKLTSEPTFAHSKVLFRPLLRMKRTITLSDACARFKRQRFQN